MSKYPGSLYRPCVGIVVFNARGEVWVGQRTPAPDTPPELLDFWQMPQGGIDPGEDPKEAALRELYEETSIRSVTFLQESPNWYHYDLPTSLIGVVWKGKYRGQRQKWFAVQFSGEEHEINIQAPKGHKSEFRAWKWSPFGTLVANAVPFKREVYSSVVTDFSDLAQSLQT